MVRTLVAACRPPALAWPCLALACLALAGLSPPDPLLLAQSLEAVGAGAGPTICNSCTITEIACGQTVTGTLEQGDCQIAGPIFLDMFRFEVDAHANVAVRLSSADVSPNLFWLNSDCGVLAMESACPAGETGVACAAFTIEPGTYFLAASSVNPEETGAYELSLNCQLVGTLCEACDFEAVELDPTAAKQSLSGSLSEGDCHVLGSAFDAFTLSLETAQDVTFDIAADFDLGLFLANENCLFSESAFQCEEDPNRICVTRALETGNYTVIIGGTAGSYEGTICLPSVSAPPPVKLVRTSKAEPAWEDGPAAAACVYQNVYLHNGEVHLQRTDLRIPGRGEIDFCMKRSYRSQVAYTGPLGHGWDFTYNECLFIEGDGNVTRSSGTGRLDTWIRNEDGSYTAPLGYFGTLAKQADGTYVIRSPDGFKRFYSTAGRLTRHEDRHGNNLRFEYDAQDNLSRVIDTYGRPIDFTFEIFPDGVDRLTRVTDFFGREVAYGYDADGNLTSRRSPIVTETSTGNNFPQGRTESYAYSSGRAEPSLNHNLVSVTFPEEVATGGPPGIQWIYGEEPGDPLTFDRALVETLGGINASGVAAGGDTSFEYKTVNAAEPLGNPTLPRCQTTVTERNGNQIEAFANEHDHHIMTRQLTRGLRDGEPPFYETQKSYDADGQLLRIVYPEGNERRWTHGAGSRAAEQNVIEVRQMADPERGGGKDLVTTISYEPLYNQVATITDPRGNDPEFTPALGLWSSERYTKTFIFDYQESSGPVPEAVAYDIKLVGVPRGLGDLNNDGRTDQVAGNLIQIVHPDVRLREGSQQAEVRGSTTQTIVTAMQYNDHGQVTREIDAEGNVTVVGYHPADDPDGDGVKIPGAPASDDSGYVQSVTVDAVTGVGDPTPAADLRTTLWYDPVGNVVRARNPRGVETHYEYNALNEVVEITRGADVTEAVGAGPLDAPHSYRERIFYDENGRPFLTETEDRADVSTTAGVGEFVEQTVKYDILGNPVRRTGEVNGSTTLLWSQDYDGNEQPTEGTDPEGNRRQIVYDERNLVFQATRGFGSPEASTIRVDYDLNGNRVRVVDAQDNDGDGQPEETLYRYDGFDRPIGAEDALGNETFLTYDAASNVVREQVFGQLPQPGADVGTNVLLSDVSFQHDELNRVFQADQALFLSDGFVTVRPVDLRDQNSDTLVTLLREYDALSRLTHTHEDDLQATETVYDGADRPIRTIDHLGNVRVVTYDKNSNPTEIRSVERASGDRVSDEAFTTRYVWDQLDRLVRATDNAGQTTRFGYDSRDNLVFRSDAVGASTADPLDLFPGDINGPGNTTTYFYDGLDRRIRVLADLRVGGTGEAGLDLSNPHNPDGQVSVAYEFDGNSRLTAIADDNGNGTGYAYDALDRRTRQINADGTEYTFAYDRDSNLVRSVDPNGTVSSRTYDVLNRLVQLDNALAAGVEGTTRANYFYDGLSRVTHVSDDNGSPETSVECSYIYDSLSRVLEEQQALPSSPQPAAQRFIRGDCNADGFVGGNTTDIIFQINWAFLGGQEPLCLAACDADGDGFVGGSVNDIVYYANFAFLGRTPPAPPFPECGAATTELECADYPVCESGDVAGVGSALGGVVSTGWSGDSKRLACTYPGGAHDLEHLRRHRPSQDDARRERSAPGV